jgi:hypothetical protein
MTGMSPGTLSQFEPLNKWRFKPRPPKPEKAILSLMRREELSKGL